MQVGSGSMMTDVNCEFKPTIPTVTLRSNNMIPEVTSIYPELVWCFGPAMPSETDVNLALNSHIAKGGLRL